MASAKEEEVHEDSTVPAVPANLINTVLPEEILRLIFDCFIAERQLQLRAVCTQWKSVIEPLFATKHSIHLCESITKMATRQIEHMAMPSFEADLQFDGILKLPTESSLALARLLPEVNRFMFSYTSDFSGIDISPFFENMPSITEVTLYRIPDNRQLQKRILLSLNALPNLTRLHLCNMHDVRIPDGLTALSRLEYFKLDYHRGDFSFADQLGPSLAELKLENTRFQAEHFTANAYPHLTHLTLNYPTVNRLQDYIRQSTMQLIESIVENITSLQVFHLRTLLRYSNTSYIRSMTILSGLPHLTDLSLNVINLTDLSIDQNLSSLPRLPSVTTLFLHLERCDPPLASIFAATISVIFPRICTLTLETTYGNLNEYYIIFKNRLRECPNLSEFKIKSITLRRGRFTNFQNIYQLRD